MPQPRSGRRPRDRGRQPNDVDERQQRARAALEAAVQASREVLDRAVVRRDEAWQNAARENRRRALVVVSAPFGLALVLLALGALLLPLLLVGAALLVVWAVVAAMAWRRAVVGVGDRLASLSTEDAVATGVLAVVTAERYRDVTESLCSAIGLAVPRLTVLVDPAPNAISSGGRADRTQISLTTGMLAALDRVQLEGVLAHELAHVKRLDTLSGGLSAALLRGGNLPAPGARRLARWLEGPEREIQADLAACHVTRYPPGLLAALELAGRSSSCVPEASVPEPLRSATASQWIAPFPGRAGAAVASDADGVISLPDRLEVLVEL